MTSTTAETWRFPGDREAIKLLMADEAIRRGLESGKAAQARSSVRTQLLGGAVMVDPEVLPHLAEAVHELTSRFPTAGTVECFVYNGSEVNAFVTQGHRNTLIAVSSFAVNHLTAAELQFVIGHELGHALFGHSEVWATHLVEDAGLMPASAMRVRAWQRAAEVSADRAGLVLCGSIEAAASALFKAASGVVTPAVVVSPARFASQWQRLLDEVIGDGARDFWQVSHPFPPLRMRAMLLFWEAWRDGADEAALSEPNQAIERMLAMMDPAAAERTLHDPILSGFFFWGGLHVALAGGALDPNERRRLASVCPSGVDLDQAVGVATERPDACLGFFAESHKARRRKLNAVELHRIIFGLIDIASADGRVSPEELARLRELAAILGVPAEACDLIVSQYEKETTRAN